MIEDLFPKTVGNILDYDAIKLAAKQYVEDVFVNIVQEFADNMTLHTMDAEHLADVAGHVAGDSSLSLEQLLDYINAENIYHECDFVSELLSAFPEGVEYKEFDVTGCGFPPSDLFPFNSENRSFLPNGTPMAMQDPLWGQNASGNLPERNLLMSRYKGQFDEPQWHRKEGRRSSWGNPATWMTSGGFGKPATIHINVDEERTVIEGNGLTAVENWLGTVSNKLPINLYIEIESHFVTSAEPASSSLEGYHMSFPYEEEEGFCTNDQNMSVSPNNATPPTPPPPPPPPEPAYSYIVFDTTTGTIVHSIVDEGMVYGEVGYVLMDESAQMITVYETGVRTESFYFTTNGRNETQNTNISHADIPVYTEDGTAPAADTPYDGSSVLAFMDVDGNTKQADGESLYVDNGELRLDAPDTDEGEQWAALVERIFTLSFANAQLPGITITLPASETGTSGTTVTLPTMSSEYESGGKTWTPSAWDIGAFGSTYTITGDVVAYLIFEEVPSELTAYFTSAGAAGTSDTRIGGSFGNTPATLYDASGNPLPYDLSKKYTILGMYNYSGGSVEVLSYSILKDTNGIVQYIPGGIKNVFTIVLSLSEQTTIDAYFTSAGASATTDTTCQSTLTYTLYDANGNFIPYDSTKTYTTVASFVVNGNTAYADFTGNYASWSDAILKGRPSGTNTYYKIIIRIE